MASISVFGLGKVGHTLACCLAAAGNHVVGYDVVRKIVDSINDGTYESAEPGVAERLESASGGGLIAASSPGEAVQQSDVSMIVVPTPSNDQDGFSLRYVLEAVRAIGEAVRSKTTRHTVAVVSTVLPGASNEFVLPALEAAAGRKVGEGIGYCYNPSFIALGEIVKGLEEPNYVLIGEADVQSGNTVETIHKSMLKTNTPISRMSPIEAEITKIASNTYETARVTFANMLFSICSEVPGANVDRVTEALSHRVGRRFFTGAVPYGGPCWPRDNRAFAAFMDVVGVPSLLPRTIDASNGEHGRYILRKVLAATKSGSVVGLLGLAYKPGTHVTDCSFGIDLAQWLLEQGRLVIAWDPAAMPEARRSLEGRITFAKTPEECLSSSSVTMIVNPMRELGSIDWTAASGSIVMDPWRRLDPKARMQVGMYVAMGTGIGLSMSEWLSQDDISEKLQQLNS